MEGWLLNLENRWIANSGRNYHIWYDRYLHAPKREVWLVSQVMPVIDGKQVRFERAATVIALEDSPEITNVQIIDAVSYHGSPFRDAHPAISTPTVINEGSLQEDLWEFCEDFDEAVADRMRLANPEISAKDDTQEPTSSNLWDWFDWYHANKSKFRIKMKYIAEKAGFELSTVYKEHSNYMDEKGTPEKVKKSKKK